MLRAFVNLAETLNLSKTCDELGQTRQTVRRHLTDLQRLLGNDLFEIKDKKYRLTEFGKSNLDIALKFLRNLDAWTGASRNQTVVVDGLENNKFIDDDGNEFYSQQHSVSKIAEKSAPLIQQALSAWGVSHAKIQHESWSIIRPYTVLYRQSDLGWVFVEVGTKSAYSRWFGADWAQSAAGKLMNEDEVGDGFNEFISGAYARIYEEGGVRLDHLYVHTQRDDGTTAPATFQRLLVGSVFPDGAPALSVVAVITHDISIDALGKDHSISMPEEFLMDHVVAEPIQ